jgi:hypothetical protein
MSDTIFTPEAVDRMVAKGTFKRIKLKDWKSVDADEMFYFRFPSHNLVNEMNGDGDWLEIIDFDHDFTEIDVNRGTIRLPLGGETEVYVR